MLTLSARQQLAVGAALAALFAITRTDHVAALGHWLPSASWAVFFLAGVYLRPVWVPVLLFAAAAALDYAAVTWGGVSAFCLSPAYIALFPAYGVLWFAGRWYAGHHRERPATLLPLVSSAFVGTLGCELISSGTFYFYSGRFADPTVAEFIGRVGKYFPASLASMAFWVVAAALIHAALIGVRHAARAAT